MVLSEPFTIVPLLFVRCEPPEVEAVIDRLWGGDETLIVVSSDLSHFHPYETAKKLDRSAIDAIVDLDVERMRNESACGKGPVLALMTVARKKGWRAKLLDYRNSGDTAGGRSRVVGYAAIAFHEPAAQTEGG